jgi:hypothetical protein
MSNSSFLYETCHSEFGEESTRSIVAPRSLPWILRSAQDDNLGVIARVNATAALNR